MFYILYLVLGLAIVDKIYARYEKFPFQNSTLILQKWQPVAFRLSDIPGLIFEMVPNLKIRDKYIETNSMGIRAKEYKIPKPQDTFRILVLGDSITYGLALDQEKVFSLLLEDKLNSAKKDITYEVINASVPGYNTMQEYIAFINKYYIYEPDLVLVGFSSNDNSPAYVQEEDSRGAIYVYLKHKLDESNNLFENITPYEMLSISMPNIFHLPVSLHRRMMLFSSIYRTITMKLYDFLSTKNPYKYPSQAYFNIVKAQIEYAVKQLKIYCQDYGIDLIFLLFPELYDGYSYNDSLSDAKKKLFENNSITYIDLLPYYLTKVDSLSKIRLAPKDYCHQGDLGHQLTAEALYNYLVEYLSNKHKW